MRTHTTSPRFFDIWFKQPGSVVRYLLPFLSILAALLLQFVIAAFMPKKADFPYAFFYLIAVFVTAWFGGYAPGAVACVITIVGIPMLAIPGFRLANVDPSRLILLTGVSLLISMVAQSQRKHRDLLRQANDELDERVRIRTQELADAVKSLESEVRQHQHTELALRQSEERVDLALDAAGIGRWDVDLVTLQLTLSPRHKQIFGYDSQDNLPERLFDSVVTENRPAVEEKFQEALKTGGVCEFECPIRHPDGSIRWVWGRGKVLQDESGRALSFLGSSSDITDRKAAEHKLQTQIERLNLVGQITRAMGERQDLRSIFQVVIRSLEDYLLVDFSCLCLYDEHAHEAIVTCVGTRSQVLALDVALTQQAHINTTQNGLSRCVGGHLVYERDVNQVDFPFPQRLARGGLRALVAAPLLFEGRVFGILIAARREADSFSSGECEFLQQLSEHVALAAHQAETHNALKQAYDDLRQTQQSVVQQERLRALGQMASGIAHDINNALSPAALYIDSLLEREPNLSRRTREYLEITQRALDDVTQTVARMQEFYRQREPQLALLPVNLNVLVQQVLDLTRARWNDMPQQRGIVIQPRADLAPDLPSVAGIESEIREALVNLILNAVDAMPEGGTLTVRTRTSGGESIHLRHVHVEVEDTGAGMNDETRRRCLEPFFTTKGERGTGLGLAMVFGVMRRHNAEIEIESTLGTGTTVILSFPVHIVPSLEQGLPAGEPAMSLHLRILVADDDPLILKSLREGLEADGHVVVTAAGGQQCIDAFRAAQGSGQFDVVITDLGMPRVDGRQVATAVKGACPSTPVILLTGWGQRLVSEGDVPPNVDQVLSKPPKLRELRAALAELTANPMPAMAV